MEVITKIAAGDNKHRTYDKHNQQTRGRRRNEINLGRCDYF